MERSLRILIAVLLVAVCAAQVVGQSLVDRGKALYEAKKYADAKKSFELVRENTTGYAEAQFYLGRIAYDQKEYDDAIEYFEEATGLNTKNGEYFNSLGDAYAAAGANASMFRQMSIGPKAIKAWEEAARLDPKNMNARYSLVGVYPMAPGFMGGGQDKADKTAKELFPLLEDALSKDPDHHLHMYWYGKASALTGLNLDRGEQCLKKYVTITPAAGEPSVAGAYMRLGEIKEKQGRKAEAKKCFEVALQKDPELKGAKAGLERTSK